MTTNSKGVWRYDIPATESPTGLRLRGSTGTRDKVKAVQYVNRLLGGESVEQVQGLTLRQACNKALTEYWHRHKSYQFFDSSCNMLCHILGDNYDVTKIDKDALSRIKTALKNAGRAPSTINRRLAVLSRLMNLLHSEWGLLAEVPKISREKESQGRTRTYSPEEEKRILYWFGHNDDQMFRLAYFLFKTGCRVTEALNVDPRKDLVAPADGEPGRVIFRETKNSTPRTLPIDQYTYAVAAPGFAIYDANEVGKRWRKLRDVLGYQNDSEFVAHAVRHTVATRLLQAGWDVGRVQQWMGHKDIKTTLRYVHLSSGDLLAGMNILSAVETMPKTLTSDGQKDPVSGDNLLISGSFSDC